MKKYIVFLFIPLSFLLAQTDPGRPVKGEIVEHIGYTLGYNEKHEQAEWVYYQLTKAEVEGTVPRKDAFRQDAAVSTGSASLADYRSSGFDRGHLAPAADMKWSETAMSESFFMSNMSPQSPGFNRGIWKRLEAKVREWAVENEEIYIVTGPFLVNGLPTIGSNEVSVPNAYYKVILDLKGNETKGIGFILENKGSNQPLESFAVTIDSVESLSGLDFFGNLEDSQESNHESVIDLSLWGFPQTTNR